MSDLPFCLDRDLVIRARRTTVFRFFTESTLFARWWGAGSTIEARVGGGVRIVYPNGQIASGRVLAIEPETSILFSYGYEYEGATIAPGGSRVRIALEEHPDGTLLRLRHEVHDAEVRDDHVAGWRFHLALFANVAAAVEHEKVEGVADDWFEAWNTVEGAARLKLLARCTTGEVAFRDAWSCGRGRDELDRHIAQAQMHMTGISIRRDGAVRQCQGTALLPWAMTGPDGTPRAQGVNVVQLAPDGRIRDSVGFAGR